MFFPPLQHSVRGSSRPGTRTISQRVLSPQGLAIRTEKCFYCFIRLTRRGAKASVAKPFLSTLKHCKSLAILNRCAKRGRPEPSRLLPALDGPRVTICPLHVAGSGTGKAVGSVGQSVHSTCGARASRKPR